MKTAEASTEDRVVFVLPQVGMACVQGSESDLPYFKFETDSLAKAGYNEITDQFEILFKEEALLKAISTSNRAA